MKTKDAYIQRVDPEHYHRISFLVFIWPLRWLVSSCNPPVSWIFTPNFICVVPLVFRVSAFVFIIMNEKCIGIKTSLNKCTLPS